MRRFMPIVAAVVVALLVFSAARPRVAEACTGCGEAGGQLVCEPGLPSGATSHFDCHSTGDLCWLDNNDCGGATVAGDGSVEAVPTYGADALASGEVIVAVHGPSSEMAPTSVALRSPCNDAILQRSVSPDDGARARERTTDLSL
jgi:hypothetical protein